MFHFSYESVFMEENLVLEESLEDCVHAAEDVLRNKQSKGNEIIIIDTLAGVEAGTISKIEVTGNLYMFLDPDYDDETIQLLH